ncbi:hypothetical protein [Roseococcus sp. YIM B11640]|uniref:hypothetical protein n=1 Tax=Roseococcus sp. YIM B11640 TaxID=3133973 RepID=UPI003C7AE673
MTRFARERTVFVVEPAVTSDQAWLRVTPCTETGVQAVTLGLPDPGNADEQRHAMDLLMARVGPASAWYCCCEAIGFSDHIPWLSIVYDRLGPNELHSEAHLMRAADLVVASSPELSAYGPEIHLLPNGVDQGHFARARDLIPEPADQLHIPRPLIGYLGPVDGRLDTALIARLASLRPHWHFVFLGPIHMPEAELPLAPNLHFLGPKAYRRLPAYLCHWDAAFLPLRADAPAQEETRAWDMLAAGRRIVAAPAPGLVEAFGRISAVSFAQDAEGFVQGLDAAMSMTDVSDFVAIDDLLDGMGWDTVYGRAAALMRKVERASAYAGARLSA